jgi:hypothetical protein
MGEKAEAEIDGNNRRKERKKEFRNVGAGLKPALFGLQRQRIFIGQSEKPRLTVVAVR